MKKPEKVPKNGFYYHYKHDPDKGVQDYAYEVVGVGHHTEDDCRPEDIHMVVYRPLYRSAVYNAGQLFDLRPLQMWMGDVNKGGQTFPRFSPVTDPLVIAELEKIKLEMYGNQ